MGGTLGIAAFGAILNARLTTELANRVPAGADVDRAELTGSPAAIAALPDAVYDQVVESFVQALQVVFVAAMPVALGAFVLSWFLKELPLRAGPGGPRGADAAEDGAETPEAASARTVPALD
jgi:hypothetical protein